MTADNARISVNEIPFGMTKGELAGMYNIGTYDTALPQGWVDKCQENGFDPRGQVVWQYPVSMPYPLTLEAEASIREIFGWDVPEAEYKDITGLFIGPQA